MTDQSSSASDRSWTPARLDMLYLHYALGMTAAQSAQVLGGVTGNAVLSKRLRLGLMSKSAATAVSGLFTGRRVRRSGELSSCREPLPVMDLPTPSGARPSRLADRGPRECAWPLGPAGQPGDYRTLYCCAPTGQRRSYCPVHAERMRSPA